MDIYDAIDILLYYVLHVRTGYILVLKCAIYPICVKSGSIFNASIAFYEFKSCCCYCSSCDIRNLLLQMATK